MSQKEAAALAGLSVRAIYRAIERGELEATRLCSRLRISETAFDTWLQHGRVEQPPRSRWSGNHGARS